MDIVKGSSGAVAWDVSLSAGMLQATLGDPAIGASASISINGVTVLNLIKAELDAKGGLTAEITDMVMGAIKSALGLPA